jgi:hypothetical protein
MTDQERIFAVCVISASRFKFLDKKEGIHKKKVSGRQLTNPSERRTEMKPNKICKRSFIMAMALAAVCALAAAWPCAAAAAGPTECGLIGTWYGNAGSPLTWLGVHTAGSTNIKGEMVMHWVRVRDYLITAYGLYPDATRLTDGHGVWEKTVKDQYKYTWYAYGIGTSNDPPLFSVRVSGTATMTDCDNIAIDFTYEIFDGFVLPQDMSGVEPVGAITDVARETRVPLAVVAPTP